MRALTRERSRGGLTARDVTARVVVDGFGADALGCARLLAREGARVTLVGSGPIPDVGPEDASRLDWVGDANLDATPCGDVLIVDCWTAETSPLVRRHRAAGAVISSIGELLLARWNGRTLGVTGSGGKTTATRLIGAMLAASGVDATISDDARAANAWPTASLLDRLPGAGWLLLELTSTHLAYMSSSPDVAVITGFWPDHDELHGSLERYRAAKTAIVRHHGADGVCVVNADDPGTRSFADVAPGVVLHAGTAGPASAGIGVEGGSVVARLDGSVTTVCPLASVAFSGPVLGVALSAAVAALVCGADAGAVARVLATPPVLAHRGSRVGTIDGVEVVDASAATTPRKLVGALAGFDVTRLVVIVGGEVAVGGIPVVASSQEVAELDLALDRLRTCRGAVAFGAAAARCEGVLGVATLADACQAARATAAPGDTIVLAPMFPLDMESRRAFPTLIGVTDPAPHDG